MIIRFAFKTDTGKAREHNEDNFLVMPDPTDPKWEYNTNPFKVGHMGSVFAIADGMGGASAGEVASMEVISAVEKSIKDVDIDQLEDEYKFHGLIRDVFKLAQNRIADVCRADSSLSGMGTTLVLGWIYKGRLHMAWLGDSRGYLARKDGRLYHITKDHSYVQELLDAGKIDKKQAFYHPDSNVITKSLGDFSGTYHDPEIAVYNLEAGDRILLCSDGLNSMLMDEEITDILTNTKDVRSCADTCIDAANQRGGHDNITVIIVDIESVENDLSLFPESEQTLRLAHDASPHFMKNRQESPSISTVSNNKGRGFRKSLLLYTLISLTLLSISFLAGRLTMKSELDRQTQSPRLMVNPDEGPDTSQVKAPSRSVDHNSDQDHPRYENTYRDAKREDLQLEKDTKRYNKPDTPRRDVKEAPKKILTPIETY